MPQWTPEDVRKVLLNPVHAMGPKPTVPADQWVAAQAKLLREMGETQYFQALLGVIPETFGPPAGGPNEGPEEPEGGETDGPGTPSSN